ARRAQQRERDPARVSDASPAVVEREISSWEPLYEVAADAHVVLRTDRRIDAAVAELLALLDQRIGSWAGAGRRAAVGRGSRAAGGLRPRADGNPGGGETPGTQPGT
ncbi:MAG: hypothetical protein M3N04_04485, partial [Actinomycetota bacterium]|nr:hypothetical protein [Actinomycetota bacterium]